MGGRLFPACRDSSVDDTIYSTSNAHFASASEHLSGDSHLALMDHLIQGGMGASDADHTLAAISPDLCDALSSHPYGTPGRLTFHTEGEVAVSIEPAHVDSGISVGMDTLHDVFVRGMPYEGLDAVRDGLGAEGAQMSDLALMDTFGHSAIERLGVSGFPHETVQDVQQVLQQHVDTSGGFATVSRSEALQAYVVASDPAQTAGLVLDNGNGRSVTVSLDAIRGTFDNQPTLDSQTAIRQASNVDYQMTFGH
jgi:hypothetical protein